jgi:hypothetical protein
MRDELSSRASEPRRIMPDAFRIANSVYLRIAYLSQFQSTRFGIFSDSA